MLKTIIVPVDGSEHSRKALEFACDLAPRYHAELRLVHVPHASAQGKTLVLGDAAVTIKATTDELREAGRSVIDEAERVARDKGCTNVTSEVADGDPAGGILKSAENNYADMIVMGSRGLSDLRGLLMGSVSHKVCHLAPCTCVTVR